MMICVVVIALVSVIVFRMAVSITFQKNEATRGMESLLTSLSAAVLNLVGILILNKVYDWVALKLTDWENHVTRTKYEKHLN